jgi:hypothetical protein
MTISLLHELRFIPSAVSHTLGDAALTLNTSVASAPTRGGAQVPRHAQTAV